MKSLPKADSANARQGWCCNTITTNVYTSAGKLTNVVKRYPSRRIKNRQNRAEVISLLLSILQDGSADVNAVERSFAHLSLRAKQPATQKTPQTLKRTFTGQMASVANNMEATPLIVIQQCLSALVSLTHYNLSIPWFFLTEHEVSSGIKTKANRKGKGKETRASKYALNALLSLLDRKLIMESSGCMEQLSSLLQSVTHPLLNLLRKEKENAEEKHEESEPIEVATTSPEAIDIPSSGTDGQPAEGAVESVEPSTGVSMSPMVDVEAYTATEQQEPPAPTTETEAKKEEEKKAADAKASVEEQKKRVRTFTPPVVPEENLRLVVNVLAARECSAKTFRDTLSTINNLWYSRCEGSLWQGLIEQAQDLDNRLCRIWMTLCRKSSKLNLGPIFKAWLLPNSLLRRQIKPNYSVSLQL